MEAFNTELLKEKLEALAKQESWDDAEDFNPMEFSGGNFDDAYSAGRTAGEVGLAKELLEMFF